MQAFSAISDWSPPVGTLGELTAQSFQRAEASMSRMQEIRAAARGQVPALPFASALRGSMVRVIAEVKRSSPSKGAIALGMNAADQAALYAAGGAAAISVLTEPTRFGGSLSDLNDVASRVSIPVIRKDFIVAPVQLWEARAAGASAALLIARALSPTLLRELSDAAAEAEIAVLIEVRDEGELARALAVGATVIGVNNRNLETLIIDATTAIRLIPHIPSRCVAIAESGMQTADDVSAAAAAGADAILIGSAVSAASDPTGVVASMASIARRAR